MSGSIRIQQSHLSLVESDREGCGEERVLHVPRSPRLERFAAAAAAEGLDVEEAVHLALDYALALQDAAAFGLDADRARRQLNRAAGGARATRPLGEEEAAYLRRLTHRAARPAVHLPEVLEVKLEERTATRVRDCLSDAALRPAVVAEMVSWEVAATLEGRTLGEWALHSLARGLRAA